MLGRTLLVVAVLQWTACGPGGPAGGKPGPHNTGVPQGTVLQPSGSITVEEDGAVIEDLEIDGQVTILADNVTLRRCRIRSSDYYPIRYFDNDNVGLVVEDSEIIGTSEDVTAGLSFGHYTVRRVNIHGGADGLKVGDNTVVEASWIHDLGNYPEQHNDSLQSTGGRGIIIRGNFLDAADSSTAFQMGGEPSHDTLIEGNWLSGGGWTLNLSGPIGENLRINNNRFARNAAYGPASVEGPFTQSGNVWDDTDEPLEL